MGVDKLSSKSSSKSTPSNPSLDDSKRPPSRVVYNNNKNKRKKISISSSLQSKGGNDATSNDRWKEVISQAKLDEAKARADHAALEREKWVFERELQQEKWVLEREHRSMSANMTIQLERMQKYKEMKSLGFTDEVIAEMVEELKPLIESIKRNRSINDN
jgi:hypothetical protein